MFSLSCHICKNMFSLSCDVCIEQVFSLMRCLQEHVFLSCDVCRNMFSLSCDVCIEQVFLSCDVCKNIFFSHAMFAGTCFSLMRCLQEHVFLSCDVCRNMFFSHAMFAGTCFSLVDQPMPFSIICKLLKKNHKMTQHVMTASGNRNIESEVLLIDADTRR